MEIAVDNTPEMERIDQNRKLSYHLPPDFEEPCNRLLADRKSRHEKAFLLFDPLGGIPPHFGKDAFSTIIGMDHQVEGESPK